MTEINPPVWLQTGTFHPDTERLVSSMMVDRNTDSTGVFKSIEGGVVPPFDQVRPAVLGYDMNVRISSGTVIVPRNGVDPSGVYLCHNRGEAVVTVAPAVSQPRYDIVVAEVFDTAQGDATNSWQFSVVQGVESSTPVDPVIRGTKVRIARVRVIPAAQNGGETKIAVEQLTDQRTFVSGLGGTHLTWDTVPNPQHSPGRVLYDVTDKVLYVSNGTTWETMATLDSVSSYLSTLRPRQVFHNGELSVDETSWTSTPFNEETNVVNGRVGVSNVKSPSGQFKVTISSYGRIDAIGQSGHVSVEVRRSSNSALENGPVYGYGPSFYNTLSEASSMSAIVGAPANTECDLNLVFTKQAGGAGELARFWRTRLIVEPLL